MHCAGKLLLHFMLVGTDDSKLLKTVTNKMVVVVQNVSCGQCKQASCELMLGESA